MEPDLRVFEEAPYGAPAADFGAGHNIYFFDNLRHTSAFLSINYFSVQYGVGHAGVE